MSLPCFDASWKLFCVLQDHDDNHKVNTCLSMAVPLFSGFPQGSVLGTLLFTLYTTRISSLIHSHKLCYHVYADDTHVYISLFTTDTDLSLKHLSGWLNVIFLAG